MTVSEAGGGLDVSVTIGVSESVPATQVCRAVYDALAEQLAVVGAAAGAALPSRITVKVGRIG